MGTWWRYSFVFFVLLLPLQTVYLLREPMIGGEKWQYGTIGVYATDLLIVWIGIGLYIWEHCVGGMLAAAAWVGSVAEENIEKQKRGFFFAVRSEAKGIRKSGFCFSMAEGITLSIGFLWHGCFGCIFSVGRSLCALGTQIGCWRGIFLRNCFWRVVFL